MAEFQLDADTSKHLQTELFIRAVREVYGLDFSNYARPSLLRRIERLQNKEHIRTIAELIPPLFTDADFRKRVVATLTVSVSELFRDPGMYRHIKQDIFPYLATFPKLTIWVAGCARGEEAYSLAIMLEEAKLLSRTTIYATDIAPQVLEQARSGVLFEAISRDDVQRYQAAGGQASLLDYFTTAHKMSKLHDRYLRHIYFQEHDLVNEAPLVSPNVIFCRNVLIYFNRSLQAQVLSQFDQALPNKGYLIIGPKESLDEQFASRYDLIDREYNIWRKGMGR